METNLRRAYVARHEIMELLSDDEIAKVSTAEGATSLHEGEEYIDLGRIDLGVRTAFGPPPYMGSVLPRSAVEGATWSRILVELARGVREQRTKT